MSINFQRMKTCRNKDIEKIFLKSSVIFIVDCLTYGLLTLLSLRFLLEIEQGFPKSKLTVNLLFCGSKLICIGQ